MALKIDQSMYIKDFPEFWERIEALVEAEYEAVKDFEGGYQISLELIWDAEEDEEMEVIVPTGNPPQRPIWGYYAD